MSDTRPPTAADTFHHHLSSALVRAADHPGSTLLISALFLGALVFVPTHVHLLATRAHYLLNFLA